MAKKPEVPSLLGAIKLWRGLKVKVTAIRSDGSLECVGVDNTLHALHISDEKELTDDDQPRS